MNQEFISEEGGAPDINALTCIFFCNNHSLTSGRSCMKNNTKHSSRSVLQAKLLLRNDNNDDDDILGNNIDITYAICRQ